MNSPSLGTAADASASNSAGAACPAVANAHVVFERACGAISCIVRSAAASPASYSAAASRVGSPAFATPCRVLLT